MEDVPPRLHEKERVSAAFREIERQLRDSGEKIDSELHPDQLDRCWNQLMMVYKERDQMIHEEIARLEKLQKLAEKVHERISLKAQNLGLKKLNFIKI